MILSQSVQNILWQMGIQEVPCSIEPFQNAEDGSSYSVWKIQLNDQILVLKEAKGHEIATYREFFTEKYPYAPKLLATTKAGDKAYLLTEYCPGTDLRHCTRDRLILVLDSLIAMQRQWWGSVPKAEGWHYVQSLPGRRNRLHYLKDPQLEAVYCAFLRCYESLPHTLCHDDLLPFNVLCSQDNAVFIDWEYGGILPYLTSLARLIAHGEESEDAFFYMRQEDKTFAATYYYDHFIKEMGIPKAEYQLSLQLFLFYEYCEWIYVGNKFNNTETQRFKDSFNKAKQLAKNLGY